MEFSGVNKLKQSPGVAQTGVSGEDRRSSDEELGLADLLDLEEVSLLLEVEEEDGGAGTDILGVDVVLTIGIVEVDALVLEVVLVNGVVLDLLCG